MQKVKIEPFMVIGISVRTDNNDGRAAKDIGGLWNKFMQEGIQSKIPNKLTEEVLSVYTNYEGDHLKPYDVILGCKVKSLNQIPEGMVGHSFDGGTYASHVSKGDLTKDAIVNSWLEIWESGLDRTYTADFEVYGEKAIDPTNGEADILIAIKD